MGFSSQLALQRFLHQYSLNKINFLLQMGDLEGASPQEDLKIAKPRTETHEVLSSETLPKPRIQRYKDVFIKISGLETRGIEPVPADERHPSAPGNYTRVFLLWLSSSLTPNNIIVGLYGPSYYGLDLTEAAVCAVMGVILGSMAVGYMGTWGPKSGNRTLVWTGRSMIRFSTQGRY